MTKDDQMILLEYNPHSGLFHFNMCYNLRFNHQPDTYGWESIALTYESKARLFCYVMEAILHRREPTVQKPFGTVKIKQGWKTFCFVYNYLATRPISEKDRQEAGACFNPEVALARLGNGHFSHLMGEGTGWAWEYNPLSFKESNF